MKRESYSGQKTILVLLLIIGTISTLEWNLHGRKEQAYSNAQQNVTPVINDPASTDVNIAEVNIRSFLNLLQSSTITDLPSLLYSNNK